MSHIVAYTFKGKSKQINFSYDRFKDIYQAVAHAEDINLKAYEAMEQQVAITAKLGSIVKNFRQQEFARMGFTNIRLIKEQD